MWDWAAESLIENHDLIYGLCSGSNIGIIDAARNYPGQRYVVGLDSDQSWRGLKVVTGSVVYKREDDIREGIGNFAAGKFISGHFIRTLENGRCDFVINPRVLGSAPIPKTLIDTAIRKEKDL